MSRSRKRTPIGGITTAKSEKADKRQWNRLFRKKTHAALAQANDFEAVALPTHIGKETEVWNGRKDGKHWYDVLKFPEFMRK